ncbi:MAG: protein kinase [Burkholderiaceae bacterium]|nr:protein kinase [Burkholderiaceae bacterium]
MSNQLSNQSGDQLGGQLSDQLSGQTNAQGRSQRTADEAESAIDASTTLSHYQIRRRLGAGGFGEVYEAWDSKLHRAVAIKRLKLSDTQQAPESLLKEARLAASLQHPAFVNIHAIEEDQGSQSIVMELVPGLTVKEWMQAHPIDEPGYQQTVLEFVRQIAEAMQEAHATGLIHGDLKPSNLIIEPSGKVRILDFGLAQKADAQATTSVSQLDPQGTIAYMAPERMTGAKASVHSDMYALGTILYELLTGARPYAALSGLSLAAAMMQSSSDAWDYPNTLAPALTKLIRAMSAKQPEQRVPSMQDIQAQIAALNPVDQWVAPPQTHRNTASLLARWRNKSTKLRTTVSVTTVLLVTLVGTWQFVPGFSAWLTLPAAIVPYSQARALQQGFDALKLFDRPGSLDVATKNFMSVLEHDKESAAAAAGLSLVYSRRYINDKDEVLLAKADASAQQALQLNPQLAISHVARGTVLDLQSKPDVALEEVEQALKLDPNDFFSWTLKLYVLRNMRRYDDAQREAQIALQRFPQERVFADHLGTIFYEQKKMAEAEQAFRLSIPLQPDAVYAYANLSAVLSSQKRDDEALQILQTGLQIRPSDLLYTNLGNAQFQRGDYVTAARSFELAVSFDKGNSQDYLSWANLADTLLWILGRRAEAAQAYQKAVALLSPRLEKRPNDVLLVSRMGLYAARSGQAAQARTLAARALAMAPRDAQVQFRAAFSYELVGDRVAALQAIRQAKALGYPEKFIETEPDLLALRRDPRYSTP